MAHKPLFGTSTRVESDILGFSDGKKLGHYAGTINLRELETPSKTGEIAEFDGHLAGQFNGPHSFDLKGTINRAGGVLFDKSLKDGIATWDGMFMPSGHLLLTNSAGHNMDYQLPQKSVWGTVFKASGKRYYCHGKGDRFDVSEKKIRRVRRCLLHLWQ